MRTCVYDDPHAIESGGRLWVCTGCEGEGNDPMTQSCGSCGSPISDEVARITARLISGLDKKRAGDLANMHEGSSPEHLCAPCFNATTSVLNGA